MSNSASIAFKNGRLTSPVLFDHWGGKNLKKAAKAFVQELKASEEFKGRLRGTPLGRLEPSIVMVNFLVKYTEDVRKEFMLEGSQYIPSSLYLEKCSTHGDNHDNGHAVINVEKV